MATAVEFSYCTLYTPVSMMAFTNHAPARAHHALGIGSARGVAAILKVGGTAVR